MDCVDRESVIDVIMGYYCASSDETEWVLGEIIRGIRKMESVRSSRKTGVWVNLDDCMSYCSECYGLGCGSNYCPNCGAKMKEVDE